MEEVMRKLLRASILILLTVQCFIFLKAATANMGAEESTESRDPSLVEGQRALQSQEWSKAVDLLSKAVQTMPKSSDAHNLLGYAYRKTGKLEASFLEYNQALQLDPKNKNAHEYIGEAYLLTGNLPKAEQHLAELRKICSPIPCEEYKELNRAVEAYRVSKRQ